MSEFDEVESNRARRHLSVRNKIGAEVNQEIASQAEAVDRSEEERVGEIAVQLKHKVIDEVEESEQDLHKGRIAARVGQVIDFFFYAIYALLLLRFALDALGARSWSGFMRFLKTITSPFYYLFHAILPTQKVGGHKFVLSLLVAVVVYALLHWSIKAALRMFAFRRSQI